MTSRQINNIPYQEKIKAFFHGGNWKKALTFLFFLLIAFGFWLLQYLQQKFEIEVFIPVQYTDIPAEVAFNNSLPEQVKLKIQDKGTALLNYSLGRQLGPVEISLKGIQEDQGTYTVSHLVLEKEIHKRLLVTTSLLSFTPEKITTHYSPLQKKELPVLIDGSLRPAAGYMVVDSIRIDPSKVWAYGNQKSLDSLQAIYTERVNMENIVKPLNLNVKLIVPGNIRVSRKSVALEAQLEEYTEKRLELPVVCHNLPDSLIVRLFPSTVELVFQVVLSRYGRITESDFEVGIDYKDLIQNKKMNFPVSLSKKPQWLKEYRITPENVEFLIERKQNR